MVQRALRGGQHRPAIELPDIVVVVLEDAAELHFVALGRPNRQLHQTAGDFIAGIADFSTVAILVVALGAIDRATEHIHIRIGAHATEDRAESAIPVGSVGASHVDAPALAGTQHVVDVLGAERDHAANRAGAVDVRGRAAHDIHAANQLGIEEERAVGVMSGALVVLPRAIDHDGNSAEILQAANVDRGCRIVAAVLEGHTGHIIEDVSEPLRLQSLNLLQRHHAHRRQRVDRALFGFRCRDRDGIERLDRCAPDLRARIHCRRRSPRLLLRLGRLTSRLLRLLLPRRANGTGIGCLCHTGGRRHQHKRKCRRTQNHGARIPSPESHTAPT
ncbi:hypothetical protein ES703_69420 [subsurface metagenome]